MDDSDPLAIDELPRPVPTDIQTLDLAKTVSESIVLGAERQVAAEQSRRDAASTERRLLLDLVEIADALDRALRRPAGRDPQEGLARLHRSVETIQRLVEQKLTDRGIRALDLSGKVYDPGIVDAKESRPDDSVPEDTVLHELVRAYLRNGEVFRRGQVIVAAKD